MKCFRFFYVLLTRKDEATYRIMFEAILSILSERGIYLNIERIYSDFETGITIIIALCITLPFTTPALLKELDTVFWFARVFCNVSSLLRLGPMSCGFKARGYDLNRSCVLMCFKRHFSLR